MLTSFFISELLIVLRGRAANLPLALADKCTNYRSKVIALIPGIRVEHNKESEYL